MSKCQYPLCSLVGLLLLGATASQLSVRWMSLCKWGLRMRILKETLNMKLYVAVYLINCRLSLCVLWLYKSNKNLTSFALNNCYTGRSIYKNHVHPVVCKQRQLLITNSLPHLRFFTHPRYHERKWCLSPMTDLTVQIPNTTGLGSNTNTTRPNQISNSNRLPFVKFDSNMIQMHGQCFRYSSSQSWSQFHYFNSLQFLLLYSN